MPSLSESGKIKPDRPDQKNRQNIDGVRLLVIGSEVTQGFIFDTNTQFITSELFQIGVEVKEIRVIPDDKPTIIKTLHELLKSGDFILTTGGLGPTNDDLTVDILCEIMNVQPVFVRDCEKRVKIIVDKYSKEIAGSNVIGLNTIRVINNIQSSNLSSLENDNKSISPVEKRLYRQCRVPANAQALPNKAGLAPGIYIPEYKIISLPGFPLEIRDIWPHALLKISEHIESRFLSKTFNIWGVMESFIYENLKPPADAAHEIIMGNHSLSWGNQLFLKSPLENEPAFTRFVKNVEETFAANILDNPIHAWIDYLKNTNTKFGTVESCTGGYAAKLLTDNPGVSDIFPGSIVTYDNLVKQSIASVSEKTLAAFGAVSRETALEMAMGGSSALGSDITVAITGIAGPTGGSREKPMGTVYFGIYDKRQNVAYTGHGYFPFGRERFRNAVVYFIYLSLYQRYVYYADEDSWLDSTQGQNFQKEKIS